MYKLRALIVIILITAIIMSSSTAIAAVVFNKDSIARINSFPSQKELLLKSENNERSGYEELFTGKTFEYIAYIHYTYTELYEEKKNIEYADADFDFYLTINEISRESVTYSGDVKITHFDSNNPSDKEYVMKLVNIYVFDSLTKKTGYPVISIIDYINGFLDDSDLHVENWDSEVSLVAIDKGSFSTGFLSLQVKKPGAIEKILVDSNDCDYIMFAESQNETVVSVPLKLSEHIIKVFFKGIQSTQKVINTHTTIEQQEEHQKQLLKKQARHK